MTNASPSKIDAKGVEHLAVLAQIAITSDEARRYASSLNDVLGLMDSLQGIDTKGVAPLCNPFDADQFLRADAVTESDHRTYYQAIAPAVVDWLYLVPRVLD